MGENAKARAKRNAEDVFKSFKNLGQVRKRFEIPEEPKPKVVKEKPKAVAKPVEPTQKELFKAESEETVKRDQKTITYIQKAIVHARQYGSKETALQIINKAYALCPSVYNKRLISNASQSLKAAIKAEKWAKSRKKRRHVDQHTIQKNLNTFFEKINDAVVSISIEVEKRTNQLFQRVKEQYVSELPLSLPASKSHTVKTAHVIIYTTSKPTCKATHLESHLYLVENVKVIGVNTNTAKSPLKKAEKVAAKQGAMVYGQQLVRPTENIAWFLISAFGTTVTMASFADAMLLEDAHSGAYSTYEDFVSAKDAAARVAAKVKSRKLRAAREQFAEDNTVLTEDIKALQRQLDDKVAEKKEMVEHLASLTMVSDTDRGLGPNSMKLLDRQMTEYRDNLLRKGMDWVAATREMRKQRIEARAHHDCIRDLEEEIRSLKRRIKFLNEDMGKRRQERAEELGLFNLKHYESDTID